MLVIKVVKVLTFKILKWSTTVKHNFIKKLKNKPNSKSLFFKCLIAKLKNL